MNDTERRLTESLHRAADGYGGRNSHQVGLDQVVREARSIRRRRTATVVLASAAAIAVIAPAAVFAGGRLGGHSSGPIDQPSVTPSTSVSPTPSPTGSPSPSRSSSPTTSATPQALDLARITRGPDPRIAYVLDHTIQNVGSTSQLPASVGTVAAFTAYHGGWLVADDNTNTGVQLDNTGAVVRKVGPDYRISADGTLTAFTCCSGQVRVGSAMANSETTYTVPKGGQIVGFLRGAGVVYSVGSGPGAVRVLGQSGTANLKALWGASDANQSTNLVVGIAGANGDSRVVAADTGRTLWSTTQWRLQRFSQNGAYVSAIPAAGNGDPTEVAVLDATTGRVVTRIRLTDRGLALQHDAVWEETTPCCWRRTSRQQEAGDPAARR